MSSIAETYRRIGLEPSIAQLACAKVILGEPLSAEESDIAFECTGRRPDAAFEEGDILCGRKSGKTEYIATPTLIHRAVTDVDAPGTYLLISPSKTDQARLGWQALIRQLEHGFPGLIADVQEAAGRVMLHNGNEIKTASANFRFLRSPRYKAVVVDEACFFVSDDPQDGGANPLPFILDSVVGGMISTQSPLILLLSTPWNKSGVMYEHYRDREANRDRLVWRAPTLLMNPHANLALMERHRKDRGENFYQREYQALFSEDAVAYIEADDIDASIAAVAFFPARPGISYHLGLDPGRKRDHFGAAIAHREDDAVICDWCAEWRPGLFGLRYADILPEIWQRAREYGIRKIASDQIDFGGIEASIPRVAGVPEFEMERVMTGGQSGAELADVTRALFAQRKLVLPNQSGLADEFKRLADYLTQGGGRDVRAKRGADDRSRAIMLAVYQGFRQQRVSEPWVAVILPDACDDRFGWQKLN